MYGVYADFVQTAVADYQSEFEQMGKLGSRCGKETAQALQTRPEETAHGARRAAYLTLRPWRIQPLQRPTG